MGTFHIFHSGSIPFSEQRSIFVGRRNCHAWPFVATSQEAVLILQALRRSAESGHGFAAHYSKALGKLREKHDDIGQVLVCIGYTFALDEWTACATQTKKHTEGEGKCNDNCKTAIKFQGIGPDHFASSTDVPWLPVTIKGMGDKNIQAYSGFVANFVVFVVPMLGETTYGWDKFIQIHGFKP